MSAKKTAVRKTARKPIGQRVLSALAKFGKANTDRLARRVGAKTSSVSSACSRLVAAKKLKRVDGAARGGEAVWALARKPKAVSK